MIPFSTWRNQGGSGEDSDGDWIEAQKNRDRPGRAFFHNKGEKLPEGKKQIAVQVVIQSMDKTLTDKEIETLSTQILNFVSKATGAELRKWFPQKLKPRFFRGFF